MPIFVDGYGGNVDTAIDTHVREGSAGSNYGNGTTMVAVSNALQRMHMLLKFTLSSLAGYTINSAVLSLYNTTTHTANLNYSVYAIKAANSDWAETESTWNVKTMTPSSTRWAGDAAQDGGTDGGCSVSGTDYEAVALGSFTYVANTAVNTEHQITLSASAIEALIASGNYGFIVIMTTPNVYGNYAWATSDHATTGIRPKLTVDYSTGVNVSLGVAILTATPQGITIDAPPSGVVVNLGVASLAAAPQAFGVTPGTVTLNLAVIVATAAPQFLLATTAPDGAVTYRDGYGGNVNTAQDTVLNQTGPTINGGIHPAVQFGTYNNALLRFDLSAIPAGSFIYSAKLYLGLYEGGGSADILPILADNAGWIPGTRNLTLALAGEPCWDALAADGAGGIATPWAGGPNGCGAAGADVGSRIGQLSAAAAGVYAVDLDLAAVASWFGASNYGILIKSTVNNSNHIALSEYATTSYRPLLEVVYVPASEVNLNAAAATASTAAVAVTSFNLDVNLNAIPASVSPMPAPVAPGAVALVMNELFLKVLIDVASVVRGPVTLVMNELIARARAGSVTAVLGPVTLVAVPLNARPIWIFASGETVISHVRVDLGAAQAVVSARPTTIFTIVPMRVSLNAAQATVNLNVLVIYARRVMSDYVYIIPAEDWRYVIGKDES